MSSLRISLVLGVAALVLGAVTVHAQGLSALPSPSPGPFTYTFTATNTDGFPIDSPVNGSTISIYDYSLSSWDLIFGSTEFTTGNSSISSQSISSFSATTWDGNFTVSGSGGSFVGYASGSSPTNGGSLDFEGDPVGVWTPVSTPDSGSTFQLLVAACAGLGACRQWIRRRRPAAG